MAKSEMILEEWAGNWFRTHAVGKLASNTVGGYRNLIFNHIVPKMGSVVLTELSEKRIRAFYRRLSGSGLNDRSVWCVHLILRRILDEACQEGLILENPAWSIDVKTGDEPRQNRLRSG